MAGNDIATVSEQSLTEVLRKSIYPGASDESIAMVIGYCQAAGLDPIQKPVHIVPVWSSDHKCMVDVIMPGINLYRTQAARTGQYAGMSEPEYGPIRSAKIGSIDITFPEWCKITVRRRLATGELAEFTAKEYWLENYASRKRDDPTPNAMWSKRPFGQLAKCFDSETEILTTHGFQRFAEVTGEVLQVTGNGLEPAHVEPFVQDYTGPMIVANGTRLNFCVTPNHEMLTTAGKIEAGFIYEQTTTVAKFYIPRTIKPNTKEFDISDEVLKLIGYYLADGSHTGYRQMRIAVSREYKIEALNAIGLFSRVSLKEEAGNISVLGDGRLIKTQANKTCFTYSFEALELLVGADKAINVYNCLKLSGRQCRLIVDALLEFDGYETTQHVWRLTQKNRAVIRGFEVLAVLAGYSVSRHKLQSDTYLFTVSKAKVSPVVRGIKNNKGSLKLENNTDGKVWCVTVPSGLIVVRRNGFSMICGNCTEAQALRKGFPEVGAQPTAEEMQGQTEPRDITPTVERKAIEREPAAQLPPLPPAKLLKLMPQYEAGIAQGKTCAAELLAMLSTKYTLEPDQIDAINALEADA